MRRITLKRDKIRVFPGNLWAKIFVEICERICENLWINLRINLWISEIMHNALNNIAYLC
jgi:hypothetical protein